MHDICSVALVPRQRQSKPSALAPGLQLRPTAAPFVPKEEQFPLPPAIADVDIRNLSAEKQAIALFDKTAAFYGRPPLASTSEPSPEPEILVPGPPAVTLSPTASVHQRPIHHVPPQPPQAPQLDFAPAPTATPARHVPSDPWYPPYLQAWPHTPSYPSQSTTAY